MKESDKTESCCVCHDPLDFGAGLIVLGKKACTDCRAESLKVRRQRWDNSRSGANAIYSRLRGELSAMHAEKNDLHEEIKRLKREAVSLTESFRADADRSSYDRVRRLSFMKRLRLLFNPFAGEVT